MPNSDPSAWHEHAMNLVERAEVRAEQRDWAAADALFREAIQLDPAPRHRIAYGVCLAEQERFFEAISIFTPVLDSSDRTAIGMVCHNLAAIYRTVDDDDLARRFQWRATLLQDDAGTEELLGMANDALLSQRPELAYSLATACQDVDGDDIDDDSADGDVVATVALATAALDSFAEGLVTLYVAYLRHRETVDLRGMGTDMLNMSIMFGELDRPRAERRCLLRAIHHFEQCPAPYSLQRTQQLLALLNRRSTLRSFDARRN